MRSYKNGNGSREESSSDACGIRAHLSERFVASFAKNKPIYRLWDVRAFVGFTQPLLLN